MTTQSEEVVSGDTMLSELKYNDIVAVGGRRYRVTSYVDLGSYYRVDMQSLVEAYPDGSLLGASDAQVRHFPNVY